MLLIIEELTIRLIERLEVFDIAILIAITEAFAMRIKICLNPWLC